jgi:aryl-alcohol dehydrogenase-like predicted oxidoreductase
MEQPEYNMFNREKLENEYLQIFKNIGLGTTIWSPLAAGLLTGKYNSGIPEGSRLAIEGFAWLKEKHISDQKIEKVKKLQLVADKLDCSLAALSIAWCIKNPNVTTAILGATKKEQLIENLKSLDVAQKLTDDLMSEIETIIETKPTLAQY